MEKLEVVFKKIFGPITQKMTDSHTIQSIAEGFMRTSPITFGVCIFVILGNLPISGYSEWLTEIGLKQHFDAVSNASLNILALYISFTISYCFAKRKGDNALSCGILSLLSFLIIIPQTVETTDGTITAFNTSYFTGTGLFVALVVSLLIAHMFHYLSKKGLKFSMPEGVPPMVSESFEPIFVAMIIVVFAFAVRVAFGYTPYGNFISFFDQTIGAFMIKVGLSLPTLFLVGIISNLLWFFGIHPDTVRSAFLPLSMTVLLTNVADFQAGRPLTYLTIALVSLFSGFGGAGNTLGLCISMLSAKSERYKKILKLAFIPNLFNINEPLIFGMPVMLNPIFFIPMVFSGLVMGLVGLFATKIFTFAYNPAMALLPWSTPFFVKSFLSGGFSLFIMVLILLAINTLMYYPFFKIADKKAFEEEQLAKINEQPE